jgi:hypothetical protein
MSKSDNATTSRIESERTKVDVVACITSFVDALACLIGYWGFYRRLYSLLARGACNDEAVLRIRPGPAYADPVLPVRPASCRLPAKETMPSSQAKR